MAKTMAELAQAEYDARIKDVEKAKARLEKAQEVAKTLQAAEQEYAWAVSLADHASQHPALRAAQEQVDYGTDDTPTSGEGLTASQLRAADEAELASDAPNITSVAPKRRGRPPKNAPESSPGSPEAGEQGSAGTQTPPEPAETLTGSPDAIPSNPFSSTTNGATTTTMPVASANPFVLPPGTAPAPAASPFGTPPDLDDEYEE